MNYEIETLKIKPDDVIVIKFNLGEIPVDEIHHLFLSMSEYFPNNKVVGLPNGMSITTEDAESVIKYLQEVAE